MSSLMKQRDAFALGGSRLATQGQALRTGGGGGGGGGRFAEGEFDRLFPRETALWIRLAPHQAWEQDVWDPDQQQVVRVVRTWYQSLKHYFARTKRTVQCSCGPHNDKPCYGHAIRRRHWDSMRAIEERTGIRPKDEAPVSASNQYSFSVMACEWIVSLPAIDRKTGAVRRSKKGDIIYNHIPRPWVDPIQLTDGTTQTWGRRYHMSFGKTQLLQLLQFDDEMRDYCKNCAAQMYALSFYCPDCTTESPFEEPQMGEDLVQFRKRTYRCVCGYEGCMEPTLTCDVCGNPEEGKLTDFEIRIKKEKTGENTSVLKIVGVRKPWALIPNSVSDEDKVRVREQLENPLDLLKIFRPATLDEQRKIFGDLCKDLDPRPPQKKDESDTTSYAGDASDDADSEDES